MQTNNGLWREIGGSYLSLYPVEELVERTVHRAREIREFSCDALAPPPFLIQVQTERFS